MAQAGGLTEWFADFMERHPRLTPGPRVGAKAPRDGRAEPIGPIVLCSECQIRKVSRGYDPTSVKAREAALCTRCYLIRRSARRKAREAARGVCTNCNERPVAGGMSEPSRKARARKLCYTCDAEGSWA